MHVTEHKLTVGKLIERVMLLIQFLGQTDSGHSKLPQALQGKKCGSASLAAMCYIGIGLKSV